MRVDTCLTMAGLEAELQGDINDILPSKLYQTKDPTNVRSELDELKEKLRVVESNTSIRLID